MITYNTRERHSLVYVPGAHQTSRELAIGQHPCERGSAHTIDMPWLHEPWRDVPAQDCATYPGHRQEAAGKYVRNGTENFVCAYIPSKTLVWNVLNTGLRQYPMQIIGANM